MKQVWSVVLPLIQPTLMLLMKVVAGLALMSAALWGAQHLMSAAWQQADATLQGAQAQLEDARLERVDVQAHLPRFNQLVAAGLVGGEPRSEWVEDMLRTAKAMNLQNRVSFSLSPPEPVEVPQAELVPARVQRHVLELQVTEVHEIEALRLMQAVQAHHAPVSRMAACLFDSPSPTGLTAKCRIHFLNIAPLPAAHDLAARQGAQ